MQNTLKTLNIIIIIWRQITLDLFTCALTNVIHFRQFAHVGGDFTHISTHVHFCMQTHTHIWMSQVWQHIHLWPCPTNLVTSTQPLVISHIHLWLCPASLVTPAHHQLVISHIHLWSCGPASLVTSTHHPLVIPHLHLWSSPAYLATSTNHPLVIPQVLQAMAKRLPQGSFQKLGLSVDNLKTAFFSLISDLTTMRTNWGSQMGLTLRRDRLRETSAQRDMRAESDRAVLRLGCLPEG